MSGDEYLRHALILCEARRSRAEYALRVAGLPVPGLPEGADEILRLFHAAMLCPRCSAQLPMSMGATGWFCVHCGAGWAPEWKHEDAGGSGEPVEPE